MIPKDWGFERGLELIDLLRVLGDVRDEDMIARHGVNLPKRDDMGASEEVIAGPERCVLLWIGLPRMTGFIEPAPRTSGPSFGSTRS